MSESPGPGRLRAAARRRPFATFAGVLVALALVLRLGWGWYSSRRLTAALEDLRRRGEPMALADFAEGDVPPPENAWTDYAAAARVVATSGVNAPRQSGATYAPYAPRGAQWEKLAAASERGNAAAFGLARNARRLDRLQFPQTRPPSYVGMRPEWNDARSLANTLADGAEYAHLRGDDAEAVERLLDGLHLGRSLRQDPSLVFQLIGIGISALALDAAQQVIPTLRLDAAGGGTPASTAQVRSLLAALLDERQNRDSFVRCVYYERGAVLESLRRVAAETRLIRPAAERTAVRWLEEFEVLARSAQRENGGQARKTLQPILTGAGDGDAATRSASWITNCYGAEAPVPRYSRWFDKFVGSGPAGLVRSLEQFHRESAERRMTAVMLAARLYRETRGRWPDDAAALVPKYLDAIPPDPFREDGGPLGYVVLRGALPDSGDRPLVFSDAGDGGANPEAAIDTEPMYGWQQAWRHGGRQYRDVSLWQPKTRRFEEERRRQEEFERELAAEAVDHHPHKPDAPGNDAKGGDGPKRPADQ